MGLVASLSSEAAPENIFKSIGKRPAAPLKETVYEPLKK
jgi:hypothetical protein